VRIISSFRDYYDSASGWDEEATPHYMRESVVSEVTRGKYWYRSQAHNSPRIRGDERGTEAVRHVEALIARGDLDFEIVTQIHYLFVGFCGLIAPAWRWDGTVYWERSALITELEARPQLIHEHDLHRFVRNRARYGGSCPIHPIPSWPPAPQHAAHNLPAFRALDCPAFLLETADRRTTLTRNPRLADLDFQRIVDPFSARQAIETYLCNELAKERHPPQPISDADRRDMKGFDRHSFKAGPGGPTRKRKKKRKG